MRRKLIAAALALAAITPGPALADTAAPADSAAINGIVTSFAASMNTGDLPTFFGLYTDSPTVLDEFAPFAWSGKDALKSWLADFMHWTGPQGIISTKLALGAPEALNTAGDRAYVTVPSTITFTTKDGKGTHTLGHFAFLLVRQNGAWKIAGWAYTRTGTGQ